MKCRESFAATLLVVLSSLVAVVIVEASTHAYQRMFPPVYQWDQRIMFFDGPDSIFRNLDDIFTYVPNSYVFSQSIYFSESSYSTEYAYKFKTNNFGLVQDTDLVRGTKSVILLGDSFTEGQGSEPWFRQVAPQIERLNYQPINGGLLGTGFVQWWKLEQILSANEIAIAKLIVIFISGDVDRDIWNFSEAKLDCLRSIELCRGKETFFRLPPATEFRRWVEMIRTAKLAEAKQRIKSTKERIKEVLPATYAVYGFLLNFAKGAPPKREDAPRQTGLPATAIKKMVEKYGRENVLFIQLPHKEEIDGAILPNGLLARKLIRDVGARFADGTSLCGLNQSDFFMRDGHPNQQGYGKIAKCVAQIITPFLTQDR